MDNFPTVKSLSVVVLVNQAHASKAYNLGFGRHAAKSTLADAAIIASSRSLLSGSSKRLDDVEIDVFKLNRDIYAFDSTTVDYSHRISAMNFPINKVLIVTIFVEIITAND